MDEYDAWYESNICAEFNAYLTHGMNSMHGMNLRILIHFMGFI